MSPESDAREDADLFERRKREFQRFRTPPDGLTAIEARTLALRASERIGQLPRETLDFLDIPPRTEVELELVAGGQGSAEVARRPRGAPAGFVGRAASVEVAAVGDEDPVLKVVLSDKDRDKVFAETVIAFHVERSRWHAVPRSGAASGATHWWSYVASGGVYAGAGLPSDLALLDGLLAAHELRPYFNRLFDERRSFSQALSTLSKVEDARTLAEEGGFPLDEEDATSSARALARVKHRRRALAELDAGEFGPLEWQIIDVLLARPAGQDFLYELEALLERGSS